MITAFCAPGIVTQIMNAESITMRGAAQKIAFSEEAGIMSSLIISLMPSAMGCINPMGPLRVGPNRRCNRPRAFRSSHVSDRTTMDNALNKRNRPRAIHPRSAHDMNSSVDISGQPRPSRCPANPG